VLYNKEKETRVASTSFDIFSVPLSFAYSI